MKPFWSRLLRRSIAVGITLAILGYFLGQGTLMAHRMYSDGAYNPENERVLWQTPLVMAGLGLLLTGGMEGLVELFRKPATVKAATSPSAGHGS